MDAYKIRQIHSQVKKYTFILLLSLHIDDLKADITVLSR